MGIKVYRSCFQRVAGWCEAIEVVRWHSPVSFGGECSSSHRRWFRYTRNESQLGWYRVMYITPLWATIVVLRGFFYTVKCWSEPPPAGSDFGLRPSQGQSRFLDTIHFLAYPSNIFRARFLLFYISIIFYKGPGKGRKSLHSEGKVGF